MQSKDETFNLWAEFKRQEAEIIKVFKQAFPSYWENSIGNDCAVIQPSLDTKILLTKDILVEGVHFYPNMPLGALAYKALAVNISDICSDGGKPKGFLLGITVPTHRMNDIMELAEQFVLSAKKLDIPIIGGDTTRGKEFMISVTCIGETNKPWLRKNAQVGDKIYITGSIGGSGEGLNILAKNKQAFHMDNMYIKNHCFPPCNIPLVDYLNSQEIEIHAGVDISDGFIEDLSQILLESKKSCILNEKKIPIALKIKPQQAYFSGEDYELIVTTPLDLDTSSIYNICGIQLTEIGSIIEPLAGIGEIFNQSQERVAFLKPKGGSFFHF